MVILFKHVIIIIIIIIIIVRFYAKFKEFLMPLQ